MITGRELLRSSSVLAVSFAMALVGCGGEDSPVPGGAVAAASPSPTPTPTPSPSPTPAPSPTPSPSPTTSTASSRQDQMLAVMLRDHNAARREVGTPDLVLDDDLSRRALQYARELAATGQFQHSPKSSRQGQGENLWAGTANAFSFEEMAAGWINEKQYYTHASFPYVSSTGRWQDVGHYTQIIWRDTDKLGCGIATGGGRDYLVCRYSPQGNIVGQYAY